MGGEELEVGTGGGDLDGTLTAGEFVASARALCERWEDWRWISSSNKTSSSFQAEEMGYLSLEDFCSFRLRENTSLSRKMVAFLFSEMPDESAHGEPMEQQEQVDDDATLAIEGTQLTHFYEFHITYSFSYKVPVLYFRGYRCDGQPLELKQMEKDLPLYSSLLMRESKWTYITHEEHPFLRRPWFMLHPCGTSEWMRLLLSSCSGSCRGPTERQDFRIKQYLPSWLSVVGQTVGLKVPLELCRRFALSDTATALISKQS